MWIQVGVEMKANAFWKHICTSSKRSKSTRRQVNRGPAEEPSLAAESAWGYR